MKTVVTLLLVGSACAFHIYKDMDSNQEDSSEHGISPGVKKTSCDCGRANRAVGRIVNGQEAEVNQFPWAVGLRRRSSESVFCGGSIITQLHVLTAAHCTTGEQSYNLAVVLGAHNLLDPTEDRQDIDVKEFKNHEEYSGEHDRNDIALITLMTKMTFSPKVSPVCLPHAASSFALDEKYVKVLGWGALATGGAKAYRLQHTNLRIIPLDTCRKPFKKRIPEDFNKQLCTYGRNRDTCQGDSGGPVAYVDPETNRYTLVGIVSYGAKCATVNPGVNTKVEAYLDWIKRAIRVSVSGRSGFDTCQKTN